MVKSLEMQMTTVKIFCTIKIPLEVMVKLARAMHKIKKQVNINGIFVAVIVVLEGWLVANLDL